MILMTMTINHQFRQVEDQGKTDCFRLHNIILTIHLIQPLKVQTVVGVTNSDANWSANPILTYVIITWSNTFVLTYYYNAILQYWVKITLKYASSIHSYRRERPYSCPSDSCRPIHAGLFMPHRFMPGPIHAEHYSCPVGLIHARTYSCPPWFVPCKTKTCISRPFHAWIFSCQVNSCLLKDLFMPGLFMPMAIPIHASTKPQYCQTTKPNLIRFQGSVRLSEVWLG